MSENVDVPADGAPSSAAMQPGPNSGDAANLQPASRPVTQQASLFRRIWILLLVAALAIITDQITKRLIETNIGIYDQVVITPWLSPYLTFTHTLNTGAAFSLLPQGGAIFFVVGLIVCSLILYYAPRLPVADWISRIALGLQLGGALGNLIDRVRQGHVTDFIHFQIPEINFDFPVFNVADSCIVVGVILLIALSIFRKDAVESATTPGSN